MRLRLAGKTQIAIILQPSVEHHGKPTAPPLTLPPGALLAKPDRFLNFDDCIISSRKPRQWAREEYQPLQVWRCGITTRPLQSCHSKMVMTLLDMLMIHFIPANTVPTRTFDMHSPCLKKQSTQKTHVHQCADAQCSHFGMQVTALDSTADCQKFCLNSGNANWFGEALVKLNQCL